MSSAEFNVSIWDTLLPPSKNRVISFDIGEVGISALLYSPRYNLLVAGGKKGKICKFNLLFFFNESIVIMDTRQSVLLLNSFEAHENLIRSITINNETGSLITGSTKGDVKIWDINAILAMDAPASTSFNPWPYEFDQSLGIVELQAVNDDIYNCWGNGYIYSSRCR
jgi:WD40 repeat protein